MTTEATQESQAMEMPVPEKEHLWLRRFIGEWTS